MTGVLLIDKPEGLTSFGALIRVKKIINQKKCGHTGTLDPMATGILTVMLGNATRFCELLPDHDKAYLATIRLGLVTDTLDITGTVTEEHPVTATRQDVEAALEGFRGKISQLPPMYSAVSVNGQRLYELARKGEEIERTPREVEITELTLLDCDEAKGEYTLQIGCTAGTYIRTLADDLGRRLGCGAVLTSLRRTKANGHTVDKALTLEQLREAAESGTLAAHLMTVEQAMADYPAVTVTEAQAKRFANGGELMLSRVGGAAEQGYYRVKAPNGTFLGLGENNGSENLLVKRVYKEEE